MKPSRMLGLLLVTIAGCQTAPPKFYLRSLAPAAVEDFEFERSIASYSNGSNWRLLEIKPIKLPYSGKIAALSAQDRWLKLFRLALESIKEDCKDAPSQMPQIMTEELDYTKLGNSVDHPAYIQAKYMCR